MHMILVGTLAVIFLAWAQPARAEREIRLGALSGWHVLPVRDGSTEYLIPFPKKGDITPTPRSFPLMDFRSKEYSPRWRVLAASQLDDPDLNRPLRISRKPSGLEEHGTPYLFVATDPFGGSGEMASVDYNRHLMFAETKLNSAIGATNVVLARSLGGGTEGLQFNEICQAVVDADDMFVLRPEKATGGALKLLEVGVIRTGTVKRAVARATLLTKARNRPIAVVVVASLGSAEKAEWLVRQIGQEIIHDNPDTVLRRENKYTPPAPGDNSFNRDGSSSQSNAPPTTGTATSTSESTSSVRSYRGVVRLAIAAIVALVGVGAWVIRMVLKQQNEERDEPVRSRRPQAAAPSRRQPRRDLTTTQRYFEHADRIMAAYAADDVIDVEAVEVSSSPKPAGQKPAPSRVNRPALPGPEVPTSPASPTAPRPTSASPGSRPPVSRPPVARPAVARPPVLPPESAASTSQPPAETKPRLNHLGLPILDDLPPVTTTSAARQVPLRRPGQSGTDVSSNPPPRRDTTQRIEFPE